MENELWVEQISINLDHADELPKSEKMKILNRIDGIPRALKQGLLDGYNVRSYKRLGHEHGTWYEPGA